jgi:hypothetical protein
MAKTKRRTQGTERDLLNGLKAVETYATRTATNLRAVRVRKAAASRSDVTFTCSSDDFIVSIKCDDVKFAFRGGTTQSFRPGDHPLFYRVAGPRNSAFEITGGGAGTLAISSKTTADGVAAAYDHLVVS